MRSILIRGGVLHTMTSMGEVQWDLRLEDGWISEMGTELTAGTSAEVNAAGCHVLPGMVEMHLLPGVAGKNMNEAAKAAGIARALLWPEGDGQCRLLAQHAEREHSIRHVTVPKHDVIWLKEQLLQCRDNGTTPAFSISNPESCRCALDALAAVPQRSVMAGLQGCTAMVDEIARARCDVIVGPGRMERKPPWQMAVRLDELGTCVCVSANSTPSRLGMLRVCAAICWREGMPKERALRTITANGAALLGCGDVGRIECGCRGSVSIYSGHPLLLASERIMTITESGRIL